MSWRLVFVLFLLGAAEILSVGNVLADGCADVLNDGWCFEKESFSVWVIDEKVEIEEIREMGLKSEAPNMSFFINYLTENDNSVLFLANIRPTPAMRLVDFQWNIGLQLKSGEVVWAEKFIFQNGAVFEVHKPKDGIYLIPGVCGQSPSGKSFLVFFSFPVSTPNGSHWKQRQVRGLVFDDETNNVRGAVSGEIAVH